IFIKEPKPYEVQGTEWGKYEGVPSCFTIYGTSPQLPPSQLPPIPPQPSQAQPYRSFMPSHHRLADPAIYLSQVDKINTTDKINISKRVRRCRMKGFSNNLKYGWVLEQRRRQDENIYIQLAWYMNKVFSGLNPKVP